MRSQVGAPLDRIVAAIAARQDGVISVRQLEVAGVSGAAVRRRVAAGRLHPVLRGVHAVGHPAVGQRGLWQAALLVGGPGSALSHRGAAHAWGVLDEAGGPVDVTIPGATGRRRTGVRVHSGLLASRDVVLRDGLRLTTVARTLLDLAEVLPTTQLVAVLDRCEARRLHHPKAVADVMARATGRRGLRGLRRALLIARPQDVLTRSELERRALRMIARHGLPRPEVNQRLYGHEVDLLWRDRGLVVELDGRAYHGDAIALDRDHRRDADLQARGLRVVRFTWRQVVNHERWVIERLERLLAAEVLRLPLR